MPPWFRNPTVSLHEGIGLILLAVHISDGVLSLPWVAAGWVVAAILLALALWRVDERDIPRLGVLTAVFFVASQIHLRVGPTSVHLLMNGLVGVVAGRRAGIATGVGLSLQALLFAHGGLVTLGVNITVYTIPALVAGFVCGPLRRSDVVKLAWMRFVVVFVVAVSWLSLASVAIQRFLATMFSDRFHKPTTPSEWWLADQLVMSGVIATALLAAWLERKIEADPEFATGLLLGTGTALMTVSLNAVAMSLGGDESVRNLAEVVFLANLPVVVVESVAVGFVVAYLAKAKPEWVSGSVQTRGTGTISSNGISH